MFLSLRIKFKTSCKLAYFMPYYRIEPIIPLKKREEQHKINRLPNMAFLGIMNLSH